MDKYFDRLHAEIEAKNTDNETTKETIPNNVAELAEATETLMKIYDDSSDDIHLKLVTKVEANKVEKAVIKSKAMISKNALSPKSRVIRRAKRMLKKGDQETTAHLKQSPSSKNNGIFIQQTQMVSNELNKPNETKSDASGKQNSWSNMEQGNKATSKNTTKNECNHDVAKLIDTTENLMTDEKQQQCTSSMHSSIDNIPKCVVDANVTNEDSRPNGSFKGKC